MKNIAKIVVIVLAAITVGGLWIVGTDFHNREAPVVATRYHARNRTAQFFQRAASQGQPKAPAASK